ncbi:MAG: gluconokinase [Cyanobacteriota bacterium]|nr:gluconokinase [Cyanobacteriota bacterium]
MGVSGSGKSTVGELLAKSLNWDFKDADSFHPEANVEKMSRGTPLEDADRLPWLLVLQRAIDEWLREGRDVVLACSALKEAYRQMLVGDRQEVKIVYLKGSFELFARRLKQRENHFMKVDLLTSQFFDLEEPKKAIALDASSSVEAIVKSIINHLEIEDI